LEKYAADFVQKFTMSDIMPLWLLYLHVQHGPHAKTTTRKAYQSNSCVQVLVRLAHGLSKEVFLPKSKTPQQHTFEADSSEGAGYVHTARSTLQNRSAAMGTAHAEVTACSQPTMECRRKDKTGLKTRPLHRRGKKTSNARTRIGAQNHLPCMSNIV
jgi:hypothetical protein